MTTGNNSAWHLSSKRIRTRRGVERSEHTSRDDFPPFGKAQGALSSVEARTAEAGRGRPVPVRRGTAAGT